MECAAVHKLCRKVSSGGTPSRKKPEYYTNDSKGHRWVKSKELLDGPVSDTEEKITDEGLNKSAAKCYPANTVLMAMYGANVGQLGWLKRPATVNQAVCAMVVNEDVANFRYVFYALLHTRKGLIAKAQGAAQQNLNQGLIRDFKIPKPDLLIQCKIAAILSAYDDLIENNTRRIQILEEMARVLYREWFVNFRLPGHEKVKMMESELGQIPEGWEVKTVSEFGQVVTGKTPSKKVPEYFGGDIPFIKPPDMHDVVFCVQTGDKLSEIGAASQNNKLIPPDCLCVSCIGTPGLVVITHTRSQTNQQINSIILEKIVCREFLYFALSDLKPLIEQYAATGATMPNLSKGKFEGLRLIRPHINTITQFHELVEPIFDQIGVLQVSNVNLRQIRDLLLPRLISGELDVSDLIIKTEGREP